MERKYELNNVYDYLLNHYDLEWKGFQIRNTKGHRTANEDDFDGDYLYEFAVVYQGKSKKLVTLNVTNDKFIVGGYKAPEVSWKDFLDNQKEQDLTK
ncbi:MAG: hypothetical protein IJ358_01545 [Clostridia bacterium]|nr:hypothetical protein [Clostridia bacterium]